MNVDDEPAAWGSVLATGMVSEKTKSELAFTKTAIKFAYIFYVTDLEYDWL